MGKKNKDCFKNEISKKIWIWKKKFRKQFNIISINIKIVIILLLSIILIKKNEINRIKNEIIDEKYIMIMI
jgi:hypothetical protein